MGTVSLSHGKFQTDVRHHITTIEIAGNGAACLCVNHGRVAAIKTCSKLAGHGNSNVDGNEIGSTIGPVEQGRRVKEDEGEEERTEIDR